MNCPICGSPAKLKSRPFCSKRCADVDLARWFNGSYSVPSERLDDADELAQALNETVDPEVQAKLH